MVESRVKTSATGRGGFSHPTGPHGKWNHAQRVRSPPTGAWRVMQNKLSTMLMRNKWTTVIVSLIWWPHCALTEGVGVSDMKQKVSCWAAMHGPRYNNLYAPTYSSGKLGLRL